MRSIAGSAQQSGLGRSQRHAKGPIQLVGAPAWMCCSDAHATNLCNRRRCWERHDCTTANRGPGTESHAALSVRCAGETSGLGHAVTATAVRLLCPPRRLLQGHGGETCAEPHSTHSTHSERCSCACQPALCVNAAATVVSAALRSGRGRTWPEVWYTSDMVMTEWTWKGNSASTAAMLLGSIDACMGPGGCDACAAIEHEATATALETPIVVVPVTAMERSQ